MARNNQDNKNASAAENKQGQSQRSQQRQEPQQKPRQKSSLFGFSSLLGVAAVASYLLINVLQQSGNENQRVRRAIIPNNCVGYQCQGITGQVAARDLRKRGEGHPLDCAVSGGAVVPSADLDDVPGWSLQNTRLVDLSPIGRGFVWFPIAGLTGFFRETGANSAPFVLNFERDQYSASIRVCDPGVNPILVQGITTGGKVVAQTRFEGCPTCNLDGGKGRWVCYDVSVRSVSGFRSLKVFQPNPIYLVEDNFGIQNATVSCSSSFTCSSRGFTYLTPRTFPEAREACASLGLELALLTNTNFMDATSGAFDCVGPNTQSWVRGWFVEYNQCLALATGSAAPGGSVNWPGNCENLRLPVMCQPRTGNYA
ncbi:hypothetical protein HK102_002916 [Quaeritorhiza haematococci]|nr:hypothetical protein HK102_002916 [Quaeritorhiza haematococci]